MGLKRLISSHATKPVAAIGAVVILCASQAATAGASLGGPVASVTGSCVPGLQAQWRSPALGPGHENLVFRVSTAGAPGTFESWAFAAASFGEGDVVWALEDGGFFPEEELMGFVGCLGPLDYTVDAYDLPSPPVDYVGRTSPRVFGIPSSGSELPFEVNTTREYEAVVNVTQGAIQLEDDVISGSEKIPLGAIEADGGVSYLSLDAELGPQAVWSVAIRAASRGGASEGGDGGDDEPETRITESPGQRIGRVPVSFRFRSERGATFECRLDRGPFEECDSPRRYARQQTGRHLFRVRAISADGMLDRTPAEFDFKVVR